MEADTQEVDMPSRESAAIKVEEKSGVRIAGRACCLVHQTGGGKRFANQIRSGMRDCPPGKHQFALSAFLRHIVQDFACSRALCCSVGCNSVTL